MHKTQIYVPESDTKKLKHLAVEAGISLTELLRRLITVYLENPEDEQFATITRNCSCDVPKGPDT